MKNYKLETKKDLAKNTALYKMNEITKKLNLTARAIRYYESEGLLGQVKRSIGYTRYFTNNDILRLKEVIRLKKKGHKISQIKEFFSVKYSGIDDEKMKYQCAIDTTLIEETDIANCLDLGIEINDVFLIINDISINYTEWRNISEKEFLKPFLIQPNQMKSRERIEIQDNKSWIGNGQRTIIIDTLNQQPKINLNQSYVNEQFLGITEWVAFPIEVSASQPFKKSLSGFYFLEKRHQQFTERHILQLDDLLSLIEKQMKQIASPNKGFLRQVTLHTHPKMNSKITSLVESLVLNKDRLAIEDLSPVYIQSLGTNEAFLLSALC